MKLPDLSEEGLFLGFLCTAAAGMYALMWYLHRRRPTKAELVGHVEGLFVYPVKSCGPVSLQEAYVTTRGIKPMDNDLVDRHLLVTRPGGSPMVTARILPRMTLIQTSLHDGHILKLSAPNMQPFTYDLNTRTQTIYNCRVWSRDMSGMDCGDEAAEWLTSFLGESLRLVHSAPHLDRKQLTQLTHEPWYTHARPHDEIAYQDMAPLMMGSESSVSDLNTRLTKKVSLRNFRPNITISGSKAWDEDEWQTVYIGENVKLTTIKPTVRCLFTTIDPDTGEKAADGEPLKTLKKFRIIPIVSKTGPIFGISLITDFQDKIRVGDPIYIVRGPIRTPDSE